MDLYKVFKNIYLVYKCFKDIKVFVKNSFFYRNNVL